MTTPKSRPIIMTDESVRAILAGTKSQTRRVIKPQPPATHRSWNNHGDDDLFFWTDHPTQGEKGDVIHRRCPYGARGMSLWVRETWRTLAIYDHISPRAIEQRVIREGCHPAWYPVEYCDGAIIEWNGIKGNMGKWRSPLHMPRWASRLTLEIVSIRVERVQDISEEEMIAEGIAPNMSPTHAPYWRQNTRHHFVGLWESLNHHRGFGWDSNPWVWVVEFAPIDQVGKPIGR